MVGSRPWACAGPGRTTTKLGRDPLRRSFVVISGVLIVDFVWWTAEILKDVQMYLNSYVNDGIYIYIEFRSLLNLQNPTSNRQMRIYDICIHSSSLLDQVRCHGNALQHFWSCRCLTNDTWHKSPNHRTIGNSTWLTLIPRLFWQDAGASVHAWEKDRFGDSGVGWIFGMVVIKSINLHWQMISTFCCPVVCRASETRNLGSAGAPPLQGSVSMALPSCWIRCCQALLLPSVAGCAQRWLMECWAITVLHIRLSAFQALFFWCFLQL